MSGEPPTAAVTETKSSGADVPAETTVRPITAGVRQALRAKATEKSISRSPA